MEKNNNIFISAVVVAAGSGSRMNMDLSKQYISISGKPVIAWTLKAFEECGLVNEIILVVNSRDMIYCKQNILDKYGFNKVKSLVVGGKERQNSVYNGLLDVSGNCDIVLIHDGVRPFVSGDIIVDCIYAADEFGAAVAAVPVKDTIKAADPYGFVEETLERSVLWSVQTPQSFRYGLIRTAHEKALEEGFIGTDDAVLVERLGQKMKLVMSDYNNIKITTREDLVTAEAIIATKSGGQVP